LDLARAPLHLAGLGNWILLHLVRLAGVGPQTSSLAIAAALADSIQ
jgi:hypothetical protein